MDSENIQTNAIGFFFFFVKTRHDKFSAKIVKQFLAGNSKFPNTTTPMAMGEAEGVAPSRRQNLVPLHTYRPIFWILGQNCGGSQTQDLHHWFLSWVKTTNRQSYRHLRKRNALNRQMALHQDLYRFDPITKKNMLTMRFFKNSFKKEDSGLGDLVSFSCTIWRFMTLRLRRRQ